MFVPDKPFQPTPIFAIKPEPSRVRHISGDPLYDRLLALPTNIRLGWKGLPGTNTLAYYENSEILAVEGLITLGLG